jgi:superkiller protein 3
MQDILKTDKDNYNALVFVGVAAEGLDQIEQAHTAYKRAVEINTNNILGWQVNVNEIMCLA